MNGKHTIYKSFFPNFRSCTTDNSTIVIFNSATTVKGKMELHSIKRKNSLIWENKAIYTFKICEF